LLPIQGSFVGLESSKGPTWRGLEEFPHRLCFLVVRGTRGTRPWLSSA